MTIEAPMLRTGSPPSMPPDRTTSVPPPLTVAPSVTPADETIISPPLSTVVLLATPIHDLNAAAEDRGADCKAGGADVVVGPKPETIGNSTYSQDS